MTTQQAQLARSKKQMPELGQILNQPLIGFKIVQQTINFPAHDSGGLKSEILDEGTAVRKTVISSFPRVAKR